MNLIALAFFLVNASALLLVRRRWAPVPLLVSCCYMTIGQGIEIGPFSFPVYRMILMVGLVRVLLRRERVQGGVNSIDRLVVIWAAWLFTASLFHEWAPGSGPVFASGFIFNISLVYFLLRTWCSAQHELIDLTRILAVLLVPVAMEMVFEHMNRSNAFSVFGGVPEAVHVRDGALRAQGPFQHPILAGTVGAVCFPLMIGLWQRHRPTSIIGASAGIVMVLASASSGPAMSLVMGAFALAIWHYRAWVKGAWIAVACAYLALELVMSRPAYYVISRFDLTGSSSGWHRARLIEAALEHFGEWWLVGTDRTIHWMGVSIGWSERHSDITNYYLLMGVIGGLPATLLVFAIMWRAFRWVGEDVRSASTRLPDDRFMLWCFGAGLFAHATTSLSVAYFDQSMIFFWLNIAAIASTHSTYVIAARAAQTSRSGMLQIRPVSRWARAGRLGVRHGYRRPRPVLASPGAFRTKP